MVQMHPPSLTTMAFQLHPTGRSTVAWRPNPPQCAQIGEGLFQGLAGCLVQGFNCWSGDLLPW